ncbi:UNVERIFIED_CONTAM: hypothetical protein Sradi_3561700 [Sesamum radiatum]|uniref:Uncharacterized protein n=1 Tax=Sesamum radiatum TaxID=300843 RepID=A0AAW2QG86_SESRA
MRECQLLGGPWRTTSLRVGSASIGPSCWRPTGTCLLFPYSPGASLFSCWESCFAPLAWELQRIALTVSTMNSQSCSPSSRLMAVGIAARSEARSRALSPHTTYSAGGMVEHAVVGRGVFPSKSLVPTDNANYQH